jgi:hypothetical protein
MFSQFNSLCFLVLVSLHCANYCSLIFSVNGSEVFVAVPCFLPFIVRDGTFSACEKDFTCYGYTVPLFLCVCVCFFFINSTTKTS